VVVVAEAEVEGESNTTGPIPTSTLSNQIIKEMKIKIIEILTVMIPITAEDVVTTKEEVTEHVATLVVVEVAAAVGERTSRVVVYLSAMVVQMASSVTIAIKWDTVHLIALKEMKKMNIKVRDLEIRHILCLTKMIRKTMLHT
jgi:hypothetical protein